MPRRSNLIFAIPFLLTVFGLFMIYESSSITAARLYNDAFYFIKNQTLWLILSLVVFVIFYHLDYHLLYGLALFFLLGNLILLLLVFIPGLFVTALGAKRWLKIGFIGLQPSELTKLTLITYLSAWFSYKERSRFFAFLILTGLIIGLVMLQPDLGTAVILCTVSVFLYFISGASIRHLLLLVPVAIGGFILLSILSPYRLHRLLVFMNPETDPLGIGYHIRQINIALSLGGFFGTGFGNSRQKFQFLPEAHTDSIFAIIGENFGFIGTCIVILAYVTLFVHVYYKLRDVKDRLGFLLASGIIFLIMFQTFVNLGAMVQVLPLTGVPLPFVSYGGSSLITFYALLGILLNVLKQNRTSYGRR